MSVLSHPQIYAYKYGESTRRDMADSKWIRQRGKKVAAELRGCFDNGKSLFSSGQPLFSAEYLLLLWLSLISYQRNMIHNPVGLCGTSV